MAPAVTVDRLVKRYGSLTAVDGVSFEIPEGIVFGLLGPNGAGKTTTLEIVEGLRPFDEGRVTVVGIDVRARPRAIKAEIGIQLQSSSYFDLLTVRETIDLFGSFYPRRLPSEALLERFRLTEKAGAFVRDLSGGQRQRLSVALALVNDPRLVFLDEPSAGLDPQARRVLWESIRAMREEGRTVVLTTHYIEEAEFLCDELVVMDRGRIIAQGSPRELIRRYLPGTVVEIDPLPGVDVEALRLAGVDRVETRADAWVLETASLEETLVALVGFAEAHGLKLEGLRTRSATLEDVFLELTGRRLREGEDEAPGEAAPERRWRGWLRG